MEAKQKAIYIYLSPNDELMITPNNSNCNLIAQFTKPEQLIRYLLGEYNINRIALIWDNNSEVWESTTVKRITLNQITNLFK